MDVIAVLLPLVETHVFVVCQEVQSTSDKIVHVMFFGDII